MCLGIYTTREKWLRFFEIVKSFVVYKVLSLYEHLTGEFGFLVGAKF